MLRCVRHPDVRFPVSRYSSVRVRLHPAQVRRVRRCVQANGAPCIPRGRRRVEFVRLASVLDFRLPDRCGLAVVPVLPHAAPVSATFHAE